MLVLPQGVLLRRTKQSKIDGQPIIDLPKRVQTIRKACERRPALAGRWRCGELQNRAAAALRCIAYVVPSLRR